MFAKPIVDTEVDLDLTFGTIPFYWNSSATPRIAPDNARVADLAISNQSEPATAPSVEATPQPSIYPVSTVAEWRTKIMPTPKLVVLQER